MFSKTILIDSAEKTDIVDITSGIKEVVKNSGVKDGFVLIFTPHTTTAIRMNENEEGLLKDIKKFLEEEAPSSKDYFHDKIEDRKCPPDEPSNAHSHIRSLLLGASETIPVMDSKLILGTWQSIFFIDLDGPRKRKVIVQVNG